MIARRSASESRDHCAISCKVRPQPWQSLLAGSITQTLMQGLEIAFIIRPSR
jgi:hypothetical protein